MQAQPVEDLRWWVGLMFSLLHSEFGKQVLEIVKMDDGSGFIVCHTIEIINIVQCSSVCGLFVWLAP